MKGLAEIALAEINAQEQLDATAKQINALLTEWAGQLAVHTTRQSRLKAITDRRLHAKRFNEILAEYATDLNSCVDRLEPLIQSFAESSRTIRDGYRAYLDWYRKRPDMWKGVNTTQREAAVRNLSMARSTTDLALKVREAARMPIGRRNDVDDATARYIVVLDKLIAGYKALEDRALEWLAFMDGEGPLLDNRN